ncbi:SCO7613 C-terminal domain-containing membrane protein [Agromyces ramosus]|uniref:Membrane protein DUF2157 n=1 Tax=Agromyces ramosus TaxID=33879 RepID=A0ABU0R7T4_9MICO|nr:hypothetical protein [Agromyces ramosus]MDQ0894135.1 hypothetical protein [Agromyces ramosus]
MVSTWNERAARYLLATTICPRCDAELGIALVCPVCAADLRGPAGALVWRASQRAADAVLERERVIAALPTAVAVASAQAGSAAATSVAPAASSPASTTAAVHADAASDATSQVSVQSVLAVAGAALFAIAAIVFTFLNPDIDFGTRTTVIAVVTALFLGGAWMLRRRGVRFSAEAIGALGMVFLALDVWALSEAAPAAVSGWVVAAAGTLLASLAMLAVAWAARIRTWLWASLVGLAVVPAFLGYAGDAWGAIWGHVGVAAVALAGHEVVRRATGRFESDLRADRVTLAVLQVLATVVVLGQLLFLQVTGAWSSNSGEVLARVAILIVLAALATLSTRNGMPRFWSFSAGALGVTALAVLPLASPALDPAWLATLLPLMAAIGVAATGLVGARGLLRARPVQAGALVVALGVTLPAVMIALGTLLGILMEFVAVTALAARNLDAEQSAFNLPIEAELAGVLGLFAAALGLAALAAATRRVSSPETRGGFPVGVLGLALWVSALGALAAIGWSGIVPLAQTGIGIAAALAAGAAVLVPSSRFTRARGSIRAPFIVFAHVALVETAFISWTDAAITVPVGAVIVAAVLALAATAPAAARAVYVAAAYAYALVLFATALDRTTILDTIAVLCLTTTLAALIALAATLVRQVSARAWYAILIVTAVPFLIGIASVLSERSGWTALSTGVIFLLALALVLTRRPGLNRLVRSAAAALLVPALAVVVVCLGAELLDVSGSPVVLPIIAVIVAVVLPSTKLIEAALLARGLGTGDAASVRLWVEISSLVTAAIAVVLALVRDAAGLGTAIAVLVILGLGAAATSVFAGRRYGWPLAGATWTGALWCVWAMLGIEVVEPYTLPPALGAAVVAAILVARGGRGVALFTSGLACAIVPSLVLLAAWGPGDVVAWRTTALLAASAVLLALGWLLTRRGRDTGTSTGIRMLRAPLLAGALVAASAGPIQAVRYGLERDPLALADPDLVILPVLGLTLVSVVLAGVAASLLRRGARDAAEPSTLDRWLLGSRWLYAPALVFLVVGPIAAIRRDWFAIWTLWALMALLLALALAMVARARSTKPVLPPFWFIYALAWVTGVAGWSERDLRVEVFSLPLGLAVLAAGIIALRPGSLPTRATLNSWPIGFRGSWRLLAPGIVLTFLPSVLATGTDPQLYRPILVIGLALVAILVGSSRKLAAPFILGLAVLPIENIVVFSAQVDRAVGAMPWWITLSTAGAVLLAIAVGSERRTNQGRGVAARLRELE